MTRSTPRGSVWPAYRSAAVHGSRLVPKGERNASQALGPWMAFTRVPGERHRSVAAPHACHALIFFDAVLEVVAMRWAHPQPTSLVRTPLADPEPFTIRMYLNPPPRIAKFLSPAYTGGVSDAVRILGLFRRPFQLT